MFNACIVTVGLSPTPLAEMFRLSYMHHMLKSVPMIVFGRARTSDICFIRYAHYVSRTVVYISVVHDWTWQTMTTIILNCQQLTDVGVEVIEI